MENKKPKNRKAYLKNYQDKYMGDYHWRWNKKFMDPVFTALWQIVDNKADCISYCLAKTMYRYLTEKQYMSERELQAYLHSGVVEKIREEQKQMIAESAHGRNDDKDSSAE